MIDILSKWITSITAVSILSAIALTVTPAGNARKAVRLVSGILLMLAVLAPVTQLKYKDIGLSMPDIKDDKTYNSGIESGQTVLKELIQERTGAYIGSKAHALGVNATVICEIAETKEGSLIPTAVTLNTDSPPDEKTREELSAWIAAEFGITLENQMFTVGGS